MLNGIFVHLKEMIQAFDVVKVQWSSARLVQVIRMSFYFDVIYIINKKAFTTGVSNTEKHLLLMHIVHCFQIDKNDIVVPTKEFNSCKFTTL